MILDVDAPDDPVHGSQEGRFFHGYYGHYCFLPLYVFCGEQLLVSYLRPSNIDAAKHSAAPLKLLVMRLRQAWPQVRIIFRGDSGFCRQRLLNWCDRNRVHYMVGLVESRCGAVAVGSVCLLPPLSSGGAQVTLPSPRFHTPLIEPDMQISRIRLSDKTSRLRPRHAAPSRG